jgi:hypothetical protein
MIVRQFRAEGIRAFQEFLARARINPAEPLPTEILENDVLAEVVRPNLEAQRQQFATKGDAARYIKELLAPLPEGDVAENTGLWTWLTLFYFDQVCSLRAGGRTVKNDYHYIFEPKNSRHFYRHLLFISWRVLTVAQGNDRLFLTSRLPTLDAVTTEVMKRLFLTRIPCMFEVLDRLYWDKSRGKPRSGIVGHDVHAGDLRHRLPVRIRQLEKTYDLLSLNANQLIELLGDEFQRPFKRHQKDGNRHETAQA